MKRLRPQIWNSQMGHLVRLAVISIVLFLLSVGFSLVLSSSTLHRYSSEAVLRGYDSAALQLQDMITRGLNFGRPLQGFAGLQEQLARVQSMASGLENIVVYTTQGEVAYSLKDVDQGLEYIQQNAKDVPQTAWKVGKNYYRILPLGENPQKPAGYLVLSVEASVLDAPYGQYVRNMLLLIVLLGGMTCFAQLGWFSYITASVRDIVSVRRSISFIFFVFIAGAQLVFASIAMYTFMAELRHATHFSAELSGRFLASDLEVLQNKNVNINNIAGLQEHMQEMLADSPTLGAMRIVKDGHVVHAVGTEFTSFTISSPMVAPIYTYWQSNSVPRTEIGTVEVFPSAEYINQIFKRMFLDQGTSIAISLILLWQLISFATGSVILAHSGQFLKRRSSDGQSLTTDDLVTASLNPWEKQKLLLEAALFIFFCAYDLVMSFIPLVANKLPSDILPISESLQRALPISAEACFATMAVLVSGALNRRFGWKKLMLLSVLSAMLGSILAYASFDVALFIVSRALSGFGMGMMLIAAQFCVVENTEHRLSGLSGIYAALFAGAICGSAGGGMLYDLFDYHVLFMLSAVIMGVVILILSYLKSNKVNCAKEIEKKRASAWREYLRPSFLIPALLVGLPAGIVLTGFLYLLVPTIMKNLGVSQADIGRLFMLYGLCFVFLGPYLANLASKFQSQRIFVILIGLTGGGAILCASFFPSYTGFLLAVFLVGISQCLISSSMLEYILALPSMQKLDKAMTSSAYRMCERSGQIIGPMLCSMLILQGLPALIPLGLTIILGGGIFALSSRVAK